MRVLNLCIYLFLFLNITYAQIIIAYDTQDINNSKKPTSNQKIELEKIAKIADENNINVTFRAIPWKRALLLLEKGKIDGVIQASYKISRAEYAVYPMKNGVIDSNKRLNNGNSYYIYKNVNSLLVWDGKKFIGSGIVAVMENYAVIDDLIKHPNIKIKTFSNNSEIIRKLANNQFDAYAGSAFITDKLLKKIPSLSKNIVKESLPIRKKDYFLIFSKIRYKDNHIEMNAIWDGLKKYNLKK